MIFAAGSKLPGLVPLLSKYLVSSKRDHFFIRSNQFVVIVKGAVRPAHSWPCRSSAHPR